MTLQIFFLIVAWASLVNSWFASLNATVEIFKSGWKVTEACHLAAMRAKGSAIAAALFFLVAK